MTDTNVLLQYYERLGLKAEQELVSQVQIDAKGFCGVLGAGDDTDDLVYGGYVGGMQALQEYSDGVYSKQKEKLIREIAYSVFKAMGSRGNIDQVKSTMPIESIVASLRKLVPNPKGGKKFSDSFNKSDKDQIKVCKTLAEGINEAYKNKIIDMSNPSRMCESVAEVMESLLTGLHSEFTAVAADIGRVMKNMTEVRRLMDSSYGKLRDVIRSSSSPSAQKQSEAVDQVYRIIKAEYDRQFSILANLTGTVIGDTNKTIISLLEDNKDFAKMVKDIRATVGTTEFGDKLSYLLSGVTSTTYAAEMIARQLKVLGMSVQDFKNAKDLNEIKMKVYQTIEKKHPSISDLDKMMKAAEIIFRADYNHKAISEQLSKLGGGIPQRDDDDNSRNDDDNSRTDNIEGGCDCTKGGDDDEVLGGGKRKGGDDDEDDDLAPYWKKKSMSAKIKTRQKTKEFLLRDFKDMMKAQYRKIVDAGEVLVKHLGKDIKATDDMDKFIQVICSLENLDKEYFHEALSGYLKDAVSRSAKERFLNQYKLVAVVAEPLIRGEGGQYFKAFSDACMDLVKQVNNFNDTIFNAITEIQVDPPEKIREELKKEGTDLFKMTAFGGDDAYGGDTQDAMMGTGRYVSFDKVKMDLRYFYNIANIKTNLQKIGEELHTFSEDYEQVLGEEAGWMIERIRTYYEKRISEVELSNDASLSINGKPKVGYIINNASSDDLNTCMTGVIGNGFNDIGTVTPATLEDTKKKIALAYKNILKRQLNAKIKMIEVAQAVDLYMMSFTESIVKNPDTIKNIVKMLDQVEIVSRWFTERSGDNLAYLFECFPAGKDAAGDLYMLGASGIIDADGRQSNPLFNANTEKHYYQLIQEKYQLKDDGTNTGNENEKSIYLPGNPYLGRFIDNDKRVAGIYKLSDKVIKSMRALENILSVFSSVGSKLGNDSVKSVMTPGQIFNNLCEYISVSALTTGFATSFDKVIYGILPNCDNHNMLSIAVGGPPRTDVVPQNATYVDRYNPTIKAVDILPAVHPSYAGLDHVMKFKYQLGKLFIYYYGYSKNITIADIKYSILPMAVLYNEFCKGLLASSVNNTVFARTAANVNQCNSTFGRLSLHKTGLFSTGMYYNNELDKLKNNVARIDNTRISDFMSMDDIGPNSATFNILCACFKYGKFQYLPMHPFPYIFSTDAQFTTHDAANIPANHLVTISNVMGCMYYIGAGAETTNQPATIFANSTTKINKLAFDGKISEVNSIDKVRKYLNKNGYTFNTHDDTLPMDSLFLNARLLSALSSANEMVSTDQQLDIQSGNLAGKTNGHADTDIYLARYARMISLYRSENITTMVDIMDDYSYGNANVLILASLNILKNKYIDDRIKYSYDKLKEHVGGLYEAHTPFLTYLSNRIISALTISSLNAANPYGKAVHSMFYGQPATRFINTLPTGLNVKVFFDKWNNSAVLADPAYAGQPFELTEQKRETIYQMLDDYMMHINEIDTGPIAGSYTLSAIRHDALKGVPAAVGLYKKYTTDAKKQEFDKFGNFLAKTNIVLPLTTDKLKGLRIFSYKMQAYKSLCSKIGELVAASAAAGGGGTGVHKIGDTMYYHYNCAAAAGGTEGDKVNAFMIARHVAAVTKYGGSTAYDATGADTVAITNLYNDATLANASGHFDASMVAVLRYTMQYKDAMNNGVGAATAGANWITNLAIPTHADGHIFYEELVLFAHDNDVFKSDAELRALFNVRPADDHPDAGESFTTLVTTTIRAAGGGLTAVAADTVCILENDTFNLASGNSIYNYMISKPFTNILDEILTDIVPYVPTTARIANALDIGTYVTNDEFKYQLANNLKVLIHNDALHTWLYMMNTASLAANYIYAINIANIRPYHPIYRMHLTRENANAFNTADTCKQCIYQLATGNSEVAGAVTLTAGATAVLVSNIAPGKCSRKGGPAILDAAESIAAIVDVGKIVAYALQDVMPIYLIDNTNARLIPITNAATGTAAFKSIYYAEARFKTTPYIPTGAKATANIGTLTLGDFVTVPADMRHIIIKDFLLPYYEYIDKMNKRFCEIADEEYLLPVPVNTDGVNKSLHLQCTTAISNDAARPFVRNPNLTTTDIPSNLLVLKDIIKGTPVPSTMHTIKNNISLGNGHITYDFMNNMHPYRKNRGLLTGTASVGKDDISDNCHWLKKYLSMACASIPMDNFGSAEYHKLDNDYTNIRYNLAGWEDNFYDTDPLFHMSIKSIVCKVFTTIDAYRLFNCPVKESHADKYNIFAPLRSIIGGKDGGATGEFYMTTIIPEALELYFRLPLLAEWYRKHLSIRRDNPASSHEYALSLVPSIEGIWSKIFELIFDKYEYVEEGGYTDRQLRDIIDAINNIYKTYKVKYPKSTVRSTLNGFIVEINRALGFIKRSDIQKYNEEVNNRDAFNSYKQEDEDIRAFNDYDILDSKKQFNRTSLPSDKFRNYELPKISSKSESHMASLHQEIVEFRQRMDTDLKYKTTSTGTNRRTYISFASHLRNYEKELNAAKTEKDKYKIVINMIQGSSTITSSHVDALIMLHESVSAPLHSLYTLYKVIAKFNALLHGACVPTMQAFIKKIKTDAAYCALSDNTIMRNVRIAYERYLKEDVYKITGNNNAALSTISTFADTAVAPYAECCVLLHENNCDKKNITYFDLNVLRKISVADMDKMALNTNMNNLVRDIILALLELQSNPNKLIDVTVNETGFINIDWSGFEELSIELLQLVKSNINKLRPLFVGDAYNYIKPYEDGANTGSVLWLEESLIEILIKNRDKTGLSAAQTRLNDTFKYLKDYTCPISYHNGTADVDIKTIADTQTTTWRDYNVYTNKVSLAHAVECLVYYSMESGKYSVPNIAMRNDLKTFPFNVIKHELVERTVNGHGNIIEALRSGLHLNAQGNNYNDHAENIRKCNTLVQAPVIVFENSDSINEYNMCYSNAKSIMFTFNKLVHMYLKTNIDNINNKMYPALIEAFANSTASQEVYNKDYFPNVKPIIGSNPDMYDVLNGSRNLPLPFDITHVDKTRKVLRAPKSSTTLFASNALTIQSILTQIGYDKKRKHAYESFAEIPDNIKDSMRCNLPYFSKMFQIVSLRANLLIRILTFTTLKDKCEKYDINALDENTSPLNGYTGILTNYGVIGKYINAANEVPYAIDVNFGTVNCTQGAGGATHQPDAIPLETVFGYNVTKPGTGAFKTNVTNNNAGIETIQYNLSIGSSGVVNYLSTTRLTTDEFNNHLKVDETYMKPYNNFVSITTAWSSKQNIDHMISLLTKIADQANSIKKCCDSVYKELQDITPMFLDIYKDYILEYKQRNSTLPFLPTSFATLPYINAYGPNASNFNRNCFTEILTKAVQNNAAFLYGNLHESTTSTYNASIMKVIDKLLLDLSMGYRANTGTANTLITNGNVIITQHINSYTGNNIAAAYANAAYSNDTFKRFAEYFKSSEKQLLLPNDKIGSDQYKYNYAARLLLARSDIEPQLDHMPGAKDIYNSYSDISAKNSTITTQDYAQTMKLFIKACRFLNDGAVYGRLFDMYKFNPSYADVYHSNSLFCETRSDYMLCNKYSNYVTNCLLDPIAITLNAAGLRDSDIYGLRLKKILPKVAHTAYTSAAHIIESGLNTAAHVGLANVVKEVQKYIKDNALVIEPMIYQINRTELADSMRVLENNTKVDNKNNFVNIGINSSNFLNINSINRHDLRIDNIIDLNVVPINVHAFMREVPFVNLLNYSHTFDRMISELLDSDKTDHKTLSNPRDLLSFMLRNPYHDIFYSDVATSNISNKLYYGFIAQLFNGYDDLKLGRPRYLSDQLWHKVLMTSSIQYATDNANPNPLANQPGYGPQSYEAQRQIAQFTQAGLNVGHAAGDPVVAQTAWTRGTIIYEPVVTRGLKVFNKTEKRWEQVEGAANNSAIAAGSMLYLAELGKMRFNTKIVRDIVWLINLQRVMRNMMVKYLSWIDTPVVQGLKVAEAEITEYQNNDYFDPDAFDNTGRP